MFVSPKTRFASLVQSFDSQPWPNHLQWHIQKNIYTAAWWLYHICLGFLVGNLLSGWPCLVGGWPTPLKNISQLGLLFPIYGKIKNIPNHQPGIIYVWIYLVLVTWLRLGSQKLCPCPASSSGFQSFCKRVWKLQRKALMRWSAGRPLPNCGKVCKTPHFSDLMGLYSDLQ